MAWAISRAVTAVHTWTCGRDTELKEGAFTCVLVHAYLCVCHSVFMCVYVWTVDRTTGGLSGVEEAGSSSQC